MIVMNNDSPEPIIFRALNNVLLYVGVREP